MSAPLVVFGEDWGAHPSSTQHLVGHLVRTRPVVWVNSIGLRRPRVSLSDTRRLLSKGMATLKAPRRPHSSLPANLTVLDLPVIPMHDNPFARVHNRRIIADRVRRALGRLGTSRPILWASLPSADVALGTLDERAVVYYCGDDFGALAGVDHAMATACEKRLVDAADLVLAASAELADRFPADRTRMLPHGVDFDRFARPCREPADLPKEPVAGYYGSIADWVDTGLIARVARRMPHWRFVLIGEVKTDIGELSGLSNVLFLGPRAHHELPAYAQHWTASLLPFRDTAQIRACNPLKLREYLAAGTPVVGTPFPAAMAYGAHVRLVREPGPMVGALEAASMDTSRSRTARRESVRHETWAARAARVDHHLKQLEGQAPPLPVAAESDWLANAARIA